MRGSLAKRTQTLHAQHQCARIDAAARRDDPAQRAGMAGPLGQQLRRFCFQRLDDRG